MCIATGSLTFKMSLLEFLITESFLAFLIGMIFGFSLKSPKSRSVCVFIVVLISYLIRAILSESFSFGAELWSLLIHLAMYLFYAFAFSLFVFPGFFLGAKIRTLFNRNNK